jgi:hypothetical protein
MQMDSETILRILTALISAGGGLVTWLSLKATNKKTIAESKKINKEAEKTENEAHILLIAPLEKRICSLEGKIQVLECDLADALEHNRMLIKQLLDNKITPVPAPVPSRLKLNKGT